MKNTATTTNAPVATQTAHTPEPWTVTENRNLPHHPIEVAGRDGNCCVASGLGDGPEAAANARLIAAAPELLAALEKLAPYAQQRAETEPPFTAKYARADYEIARAAIAKATGGAQ